MEKLTLWVLLVALSTCLHIQLHCPLVAAPSRPPPSASPVNQKISNQNRYLHFMHQINKITNEVGFIQRTLTMNFNHKYPKLESLFKDINAGLQALKKSLIKNKLLVSGKQKLCPNGQTINKTQITLYMTHITMKQRAALAIIQKAGQLKNVKIETNNMIGLTEKYIKLITSTMNGQFCNHKETKSPSKTIEKKTYKNNLKVNNWYYGSTSKSSYNAYLSKRGKFLNLTSCPLDKPFVRDDEQQCFNCQPHSIYNLGAKKCQSCKPGEMLNIGKGTCQHCYGEQFIVNHRFICKPCAIESGELYNPILRKCYQCGLHSYLDQATRTCKPINCPPGKPKFNKELEECEPCPNGSKLDPKDPFKCTNSNLLGICPQNKPYYNTNSKTCLECPEKTAFNKASKVCQQIKAAAPAATNGSPQSENNKNHQASSHTNGSIKKLKTLSTSTKIAKPTNSVKPTTFGKAGKSQGKDPLRLSPNSGLKLTLPVSQRSLTGKTPNQKKNLNGPGKPSTSHSFPILFKLKS